VNPKTAAFRVDGAIGTTLRSYESFSGFSRTAAMASAPLPPSRGARLTQSAIVQADEPNSLACDALPFAPPVPPRRRHRHAQFAVRSKHSVISRQVHLRPRHQRRNPCDQVQPDHVAAQPFQLGAMMWLDVDAGMPGESSRVGRAARLALLLDLWLPGRTSLQRERPARTHGNTSLVREVPQPLTVPQAINQVWSMDFMHDNLDDGRQHLPFNVLDDFNCEGV